MLVFLYPSFARFCKLFGIKGLRQVTHYGTMNAPGGQLCKLLGDCMLMIIISACVMGVVSGYGNVAK